MGYLQNSERAQRSFLHCRLQKKSLMRNRSEAATRIIQDTEPSLIEQPELESDEEKELPEGTLNILIVDDEPINLQVLANHLSINDYRVTRAINGLEALEAIDRMGQSGRQFDLILLDVMMPKMSGYEVCKRLRENYSPDKLPIVMLTAKNRVEDLVAGLEAGANDYVTKPFSKLELLASNQKPKSDEIPVRRAQEKRAGLDGSERKYRSFSKPSRCFL